MSETNESIVTDVSSSPSLAVASSRSVLVGVLVLAAISIGGAVISVAADLAATPLEAMGPEGRLSVPLPMIVFQVVAALAAGSRRRTVALVGSGLIVVAVSLGVVSGFFDGGYTDDRLSTLQRAYQLLLIGALCGAGALAAVRFARVWRAGSAG